MSKSQNIDTTLFSTSESHAPHVPLTLMLDAMTQVLENMTDGFIALDQDWRILYQNAVSEQMHGKSRSQTIGNCYWDEWPLAVGTTLETQYRRAIAEQQPVNFEYLYSNPPQADRWFDIRACPFNDGLGIFYRDITKRKQMETALQERERLFATLAEVSPVAIFRFDTANHCVYVNARWAEMTGRPVAAALGDGWINTLHPDDRDRLIQDWQEWSQQIHSQRLYHNEGRCLRPDGSTCWFYIQAMIEADHQGITKGYIGVLTDITQLKQVEANLRDTQQQLQQQLAEIETIYQSAPIGLNVLDCDLRFVRINQRLAEMNGLSVEAHIGHTVRELLPDLADAAEQFLRPILETGKPLMNVELTGETPALPGVQRVWLEHFIPLKQGDRVVGISTVCEEITERKRIEAELHRAKAELELRVAERTDALRRINTDLQQSESTLRSFFDSEGILMAILELHDSDLQFVSVNHATAEFLASTPADLHHRFIGDLDHAQDLLPDWLPHCQTAIALQSPVKFEYSRAITAELRWVSITVCAIANSPSGYPRLSFVGKDITDRKRAEQTLAHREEQLRLTLEFTHIGTWDWDLRTGEVAWNDNHFRLLGLEPVPAAETYQCWRRAIHPDDVDRVETSLISALHQHTDYEAEYRVIYPDGNIHWLVGRGRGIYTQTGEPIRMLGAVIDVSDRKQIEQALQVSEARYRGIVQDQTELIARFAPDGTVLFINEAYCRYFGLEAAQVIGQTYAPVVVADDRDRVAQLVQSMTLANPTVVIENRVVNGRGDIRWTQWSNRALFDLHGTIIEYQAVGRDITELKQAEQALRQSEERLQLALEASGDGIWDWHIATHEIYYSPQYFQMLGYAVDELPHTLETWYQLVHPDDLPWVQEILARHLQDSTVRYEFDYRLRTKSGSWKWVADYGKVVMRDAQGQPLRMIGTHRDVNERKHTQESLEASLREKEVLLKEIHHRVKNNLQIVDGLLKMQSRRSTDPQVSTVLRDSQSRIASIALVHEKLYRSDDLANIDFGAYLRDLTVHLFESYNIGFDQIRLITQAHDIMLEIETAIPCGLIINELVSNSLKYAFPDRRQGTIQIDFSQSADDDFILTIQDDGIGLPTNFDLSKTRSLGMTLIQGLVEQLEGQLAIESQSGTKFSISFPRKHTL